MTNSVMACMRNEAPFVVEWAAYYQTIGFDDLFVVTNNCTDGTDLLLEKLKDLAPLHHIRNDGSGSDSPQQAGVRKVLAHPVATDSDWLLHIDSDEFLNVQYGQGLIHDLLPIVEDFDAVAMCWKLFGDNGISDLNGGLVTQQQTMAEDRQAHFTAMQKTMFRPASFGAGIDHMPKEPRRSEVRLCNARGMNLNSAAMYDEKSSDHRVAFGKDINRKRHFGWQGAYINHYAVRTNRDFLMKNVRGDGIGSRFNKRYFLNSRWYRAINRNDVEDCSIQRHLPAMQKLIANWRQDPELVAIEAKANQRFRDMCAKHLTAENIHNWTNHSAKVAQPEVPIFA